MRLLVVTQKYDIRDSNLGAFIEWWDKLAAKLEKVYILTLEKRSEPTRSNMAVISMGKEKGVGFFKKIISFYTGLFKIIGEFDAILVHMIPKYVILAWPIAFIFRKPIYLWYTGVSAHWQLKLAVIFCKKVFTAHEAAMRVNTPKRIVTGHGIDTEKFRISHFEFRVSEKITILSVGRITPSKQHGLVIRAVADLIQAGYKLKLRIIGGVIQEYHKIYLDSLKKLVHQWELQDIVEFIGSVPYNEMPKHLSNAEILVNAVPFGGLDKVVLEAMASGILPLTSNSAFSTVFSSDMAGHLIFRPEDEADLTRKLKFVIENKLYLNVNLIGKMREIVVKDHNLDNLIDKIIREIS